MNPRVVQYAAKVGFDSGRYTWFDLGPLPEGYMDDYNTYLEEKEMLGSSIRLRELLLPSDALAVIPQEGEVADSFVVTYDKDFNGLFGSNYHGPAICAWGTAAKDPVPLAIICERKNDRTGTNLHLRSDLEKSIPPNEWDNYLEIMGKRMMAQTITTVMVLNMKATVDHGQLTAYRGIDNKPFLNKKRRAKNKPPVYDWVTVELAPSAPKREHQGGTHASPARHERRGHFRKYPSGKISWVKPTWVGSIERGLIVHDYIPETA